MSKDTTTMQKKKKLKPWEKAWVNPNFVFKNPRCLRSRIPAMPTSAYEAAMNPPQEASSEDDAPTDALDEVSRPKHKEHPRSKQRKAPTRETLAEWKQRRRKFIEKEPRQDGLFPTRIGFPYSDLPMEPKREAERVMPDWPPGMTLAERRHWDAWNKTNV